MRWFALGAVFVASLVVFLVALMPAALVIDRVPALRPGGAPLVLSDARGPWWDADVRVRWRDQQGRLSWRLDWRGLTPGVKLSLAADDLRAAMASLGVPNPCESRSVDARQEIDLKLGVAFSRFQTAYFRRHFPQCGAAHSKARAPSARRRRSGVYTA